MTTNEDEEITALLDEFTVMARKSLPELDAEGLAMRARELAADNLAAKRVEVEDDKGAALLSRCALELGMYQAMRERQVDEDKALEAMQAIVVEPRRATVKDWLAYRMQVDASKPGDAFAQIQKNFRSGGERVFGSYYHYEDERVDQQHNFVNIRRCLYHDFFTRHGVPQLTGLHCATDMIWADELNQGPYNARFERPSKMSDGDDICRFNFSRKDA